MSQFSGSQFKGAMRERRATKKAEAVERNVSPRVGCTHPGHSHNANGSARCPE